MLLLPVGKLLSELDLNESSITWMSKLDFHDSCMAKMARYLSFIFIWCILCIIILLTSHCTALIWPWTETSPLETRRIKMHSWSCVSPVKRKLDDKLANQTSVGLFWTRASSSGWTSSTQSNFKYSVGTKYDLSREPFGLLFFTT